MNRPLTVGALIARLQRGLPLEQIGTGGLDRLVTSADVSSPGLVLAGFVERFAVTTSPGVRRDRDRVSRLARRATRARTFCGCSSISRSRASSSRRGRSCPRASRTIAAERGVPIFRTPLKTGEFYRRIKPILDDLFAPTTTLHGSLADVFGVGLFFTGKSGIGKSECVLDLVERGHRLVADDLVIMTRRGNDVLIGRGHELQRHFMEIRGVGSD